MKGGYIISIFSLQVVFMAGPRFSNIPGNMKMSSSLLKILKTGINVFKSNSQIIKNKKNIMSRF